MKKILLCLLLTCGFIAKSQMYNNEWIDYNKTYYKFKIKSSGVYRISQPVLAAAGLGNIPAEHFQLWRDGEQVPVYTSVSKGTMSSSDYIEFWGEKNNGKADKALYRKPEYHLNEYHSLISDTACYFLTVNLADNNFRLAETPNVTTDNALPAEPFFMHTIVNATGNQINGGYNQDAGQAIYSSSYDKGEGWTSGNIGVGTTTAATHNSLFIYPAGPSPRFKIAVSGNTNDIRAYKININADSVLGKTLSYFDYSIDSVTFPISIISSNTAAVKITNSAGRIVFHKYELTYPRQFNFGASKNFEFTLPLSTGKRFLQIANFSFGAAAPVLYDLTNGRRYTGDISAKPLVKFVIQPSAAARYVLVNEESTNITNITTLQQRNFINYADIANQGDFIIISNPLLFNGANGTNPVEDYRAYRSSSTGGGYNAKVYLVDDLTDQFAFGIKKHPVGLRNFILFARRKFASAPKHVLLLGKGVIYTTQRTSENNAEINKLNLVPTFGSPASDVMLAADPGSSVGRVSIGRISAVSAQEISDYLDKVKEYEAVQALSSPDVKDKLWMKNVLHIVGVSEPELQNRLENYMSGLKSIITDTLYGANTTTLTKQTGNNIEQINSEVLRNLFAEGMSLITYFGHSSAGTLSFNLDDPESYNNKGKYPLFIAMGCNVGDIFGFSTTRYSLKQALSESYVLAQGKGTIGFIASTHFGIPYYLNNWSQHAYTAISKTDYGKAIGDILNLSSSRIASEVTEEDFFSRCNLEQTGYHGDPSIRLNTHAKPDYIVNDQLVSISPSFVSISESSFKIKAGFRNIGKAVNKAIAIEVKREFPNQSTEIVYKDTLKSLLLEDSLILSLPIDPQRDKGLNKLTITIDADGVVDELYESNNSIIKDVFIFEDEIRPIYPYNFAIVNDQNVILSASTANPLSPLREYKFEIDTTELFNSPSKITKTISSTGGLLEFKPGITYKDNTVYYWRVGMAPSSGEYHWNGSSFIYLKDSEPGFNQSHLYQHMKSSHNEIELDSLSNWKYLDKNNDLFARNGVYPTTDPNGSFYSVFLNGDPILGPGCNFNELIFNVIDPVHFKPWKNDFSGTTGLYSSLKANCGSGRDYNFDYFLSNSAERKKAMDFIDLVPNGYYVVVRTNASSSFPANTYTDAWQADTILYGSGNSLYHRLQNQGFHNIDSFNRPRSWVFIFKKNDEKKFIPKSAFSQGIYDPLMLSASCPTSNNSGSVLSPKFGPAKSWKEFKWKGTSLENNNSDYSEVSIIGVKQNGISDTLFYKISPTQEKIDISSIDAINYPYLQINMLNVDTINNTPFQLKKWQLTYEPVPEGAIAPNMFIKMKDTLEAGERVEFKLAFKNVSQVSFDSLKINMVITDANNEKHLLPDLIIPQVNGNDTIHITYPIDARQLIGSNTLYVHVNPENDQVEQFYSNNFIYYNFYVNQDHLTPSLDVTFDNVHILNGDIVSIKPEILIKLKDESSKLLLNDSSLIVVKVRYPDNSIRTILTDNDTLSFIPATGISDNIATISFKPFFSEDGEYELIISGLDKSGNKAGNADYKIAFIVVNKPMISNMLNYPNPFTTSTAFVFTLTGGEIPDNIKIQILTITGKIVREITKQELGTIRIGRNITEYKWDGTDQFGQKLANGVYLYRVVTNLNDKSLDKYKHEGENTEKYFNKGYGKMYLMR